MEKEGYNKSFSKDCVEWLINEMLEVEAYMKKYFKNAVDLYPDTKTSIVVKIHFARQTGSAE